MGAARLLPPRADIGPGGQSVGQSAQFCLVAKKLKGLWLLRKRGHWGQWRDARMTEHSAATGRDRFLRAVQEELAEAERREREFNKADREERAAKWAFQPAAAKSACDLDQTQRVQFT